ncbi:MAG: hypothetical protein JXA24_01165 [Proteobacteria bacterium]|nr:hypothetical protein [Pseudomonadota bacterium]
MRDELSRLIEAVKNEGVGRGRGEAEKIVSEAKAEAGKVLGQARAQADAIVEEAHRKSAAVMKNLDQQMQLALRDLVLKAKGELEELASLGPLRRRVKEAIEDPDFVKKLIFRIISDFVKDRALRESDQLHIVVPEDMKEQFMKEWLAMMRSDLNVHAALHAEKGMQGFRIFREGGGGELIVDADSMMEVLRPFVSERFRRILDEQAKGAI